MIVSTLIPTSERRLRRVERQDTKLQVLRQLEGIVQRHGADDRLLGKVAEGEVDAFEDGGDGRDLLVADFRRVEHGLGRAESSQY